MKRIFRRSVLLAATSVFVLSVLANVAMPYASAQAIESPDSAMEQQTKEWLYYRGMWACLHGGFHDANLTRSDIEKGKWDPENDKKGFGYFAPDMDEGDDGTVDCDDEIIFARAPEVFGFEDQVDLFCALDAKLDKDMIDPVGGDCETARDYKVERYENGVVSKALTAVLTDKMAGKRPRFELRDNPNYNAMYYWIGKRSVEVFCGGGTSLEDGITDLNNDENAVRVKIVDTSSGAVTESQTYNLDGRIDSDLIDDVYYKNDGDDEKAAEKRCSELATLTRDHAIHFSQYIISQLNLTLANYFKDKFEPSDELRDSLCTKPPADGDEIDSPEERVYKACINNIVTRFDNIVDQCAASAELKTPMEYETRRDTLRKCITKNLPPEYRADIDKIPDPDIEERVGEASVGTTSCAIEGVGWIVCPVATFIGSLNDALFAVIKQFLNIEASIFDNRGDTYGAWSSIRNIANVAFVLAFLVIIYSQITGGGIANYGIKKMLPKLVVAAILVNISFWICAIAVDISNILGSSLYSLLQNSISGTSTDTGLGSPVNSWSDVIVWLLGGGGAALGGVAAVTAIGTYGFFGALSLLLPGALVALLAFITVVVLLIARQAFIIILVVISPLAFVAYLLPNTDQWFKRWQKFFLTLLIMYPSIALLFGGAELAAAVIRAADPSNAWLVIASLVVTALPLFALPTLMKAAGGLMSRIGGVVNNPNRGPLDRLKKGGEQFQKNQEGRRNRVAMRGGEFFGARRLRRRAEKRAVNQGIQDTSKRSEDQYVANRMTDADGNPTEFAQRVAGATGGRYGVATQADQADLQQAIANAQLTINEAEIKEAKAARIVYEGRGMEAFGAMTELRTNQNLTGAQRTALRSMAVEGGNAQHVEELWNQSGQMEQSERNAFASDLVKHKPAGVGQGRIAEMRTGQGSPEFRDVLAESAATGRYSTQASAGADASELAMLHEVLSDATRMQAAVQGTGQTVDQVKQAVKTATSVALRDPRFGAGNNRGELTNLSTII